RRRRRRWGRFAVVLLVVIAVSGGAAYVALGTDVVAVKSVKVSGTSAISRSAVLTAAHVPMGTPMVRLDAAAIRDRVLGALPVVADVSVRRQWPSTVRLVITERTPAAAVPQAGRYTIVDRTSMPYRTVSTSPPGLAVLLVSRPGTADESTLAALAVLDSLPTYLRRLLLRIEAPTAQQVQLLLRDKRRIIWGSAGDADAKVAVVRVLLTRPGAIIDVSSPGLATVR
ncbi:MAG: cell division protein FtsQ/DivIB, partial [Jatrophihabitantaceae bacterium]